MRELKQFGYAVFHPDDIIFMWLEPGKAWVEVVKDGIPRREDLSDEIAEQIQEWLDGQEQSQIEFPHCHSCRKTPGTNNAKVLIAYGWVRKGNMWECPACGGRPESDD